MKPTLPLLALSAAALIGLSAFAYADHNGERPNRWAERLAELDTDGDGNISRAEADAPKFEMFAAADTNADGALSFDEMNAFREAERERRRAERQQRQFENLDADGNGTVSADEFAARGEHMFDRLDANDDGLISAEEAEARQGRRGRGHGRRHGRRHSE